MFCKQINNLTKLIDTISAYIINSKKVDTIFEALMLRVLLQILKEHVSPTSFRNANVRIEHVVYWYRFNLLNCLTSKLIQFE